MRWSRRQGWLVKSNFFFSLQYFPPTYCLFPLAPCHHILHTVLEKVSKAGIFSQFGLHLNMHAQSCPTFATLWTIAHQTPLSMGFPSKNTGVGCHFFFQGIFPIQGLNSHLLYLVHWQADSLPLNHLGIPRLNVLLVIWWDVASDSCPASSDVYS